MFPKHEPWRGSNEEQFATGLAARMNWAGGDAVKGGDKKRARNYDLTTIDVSTTGVMSYSYEVPSVAL